MVISSWFIVHRLKLITLGLSFLLFTFSFFLLSKPSFAQTTAAPAAATNYEQRTNLSTINYQLSTSQLLPSSPNYATMAIYNFGHAISCILIGQSPISPCLEYRMYKDAQGMIRSAPYLSNVNTSNGVLGVTLSMIGEVISTPPIRSSEFFANLGDQIGIKSAHAQVGGSGSGVLAPIFKLWEVSRNISYLAMIVIFIIVGLMVMFRQKLNPQTVVSVQLALPGLVIGLVMITFSYFLASLISDIAFVGTNVVGYYFSLARNSGSPSSTIALVNPATGQIGTEENVLTIYSRYSGIISWGEAQNLLNSVIPNLNDSAWWAVRLFSGFVVSQITSPVSGALQNYTVKGQPVGLYIDLLRNLGSGLYGGLAPENSFGLVIHWVAVFVLVFSMIKLLLKLITNLLSIIFLTITAPFYFLAASLPGRQGLVTNWFFNMLCNILAFPAIIAVFYFVAFLLPNVQSPFASAGSFPVVGTSTFPLLGNLNLQSINILLAFGALVASPTIPDLICRAVGRGGQAGAMIGAAITGDIRGGQGYYNQSTAAASADITAGKRAIFGQSALQYDQKTGEYFQGISQVGLKHFKNPLFNRKRGAQVAETPGADEGVR